MQRAMIGSVFRQCKCHLFLEEVNQIKVSVKEERKKAQHTFFMYQLEAIRVINGK